MNRDVINEARPGQPLKPRELQVLSGMARGRTYRQIGSEIGISEHTVKDHAQRVLRKLHAVDAAHAVANAFHAGILHARREYLPP